MSRTGGDLTVPTATLFSVQALRDELGRLLAYEEHHRRLVSRLVLIVIATGLIDVVGSVAMYVLEHGAHGTEIKTFGQAVFFTTVQLLTVSSQIKNPLTAAGRVVDIALEQSWPLLDPPELSPASFKAVTPASTERQRA